MALDAYVCLIMPKGPVTIEVCIDSVASAQNAEAGGADRVELCDNLVEGGTTPSAGLIRIVRENISIGLQVMIRPRGGDFLYSPEELEVMRHDIAVARSLGADGVVFGCLTAEGTVDIQKCRELISLARPMNVTFHRAFDMLQDPVQSLEDLITLGVDRVLTSGLEPDVVAGKTTIADLVRQSGNRIIILAGGGVRVHNVKDLIATTQVKEIHVSGRKTVESQMIFRNPKVSMGAIPDAEYFTKVVDADVIREFRGLVD